MNRQFRMAKNLGNDRHVRDHSVDIFSDANHETHQMLIGEVTLPQPEPLFKQNMVTVTLARGGTITNVAYPGAFIDPVTGNLHGAYEGPYPGQMVMVGFEDGNKNTPFVVNRYPYQGRGNTLTELSYINPLSRAGYHSFDVMMGHFSGSFLSFNTGILPSTALPGSVTLHGTTDVDIDSNTNVSITALVGASMAGSTVEITGDVTADIGAPTISATSTLGGEIDVAALLTLKNTSQSMKTLIDSLIDAISGLTTTAPATLDPATIAALAAEKAKWALLLSA